MSRPRVRMTIVSGAARSTGRTTIRSSATAPANAIAIVSGKASQSGMPCCENCHARYVVNIAISPCAKLMTPIERWISTSASAMLAKIEPVARPLTIC